MEHLHRVVAALPEEFSPAEHPEYELAVQDLLSAAQEVLRRF